MATRQALGRVGIGAAMVAAPGLVARSWVGGAGREPGARVLATALGARDIALGLGLVRSVSAGARPGPGLRAAALADAADLAATIRWRRDLPSVAVAGIGALAAGSAAVALYTERALAHSSP